jgi:ssDNA-binding Zn-finger/Zn-ribbon topoisomerase 1
MNLREIGSRFGFSESRASQLLAEIKRRIFPWFKTYLDVNFKLTTYLCPACQHENETATFAIGFDCEKCGADIIIEDGVAQLPAFDEGEPCELASEI